MKGEAFIKGLLEGKDEDWRAFIDKYSRLIYKTFHAPSFGFSKEEINDLFHDFMILIIKDDYRKIRLFEGRNNCSLATYLRKIAVNMAIDQKKKIALRRAHSLNRPIRKGSDEEIGDLVEVRVPDPSEPLMEEEERERFIDALYRLDIPKLLVTILIVYHEMDREAMAALLDTSRQNIDVLFKRAKDRLIGIVAGQGRPAKTPPPHLSPWPPPLPSRIGTLAAMGRGRLLEKCLKNLVVPGELLVGLLLGDAAILRPSPDRLAALFSSNPEDEELKAAKILDKLGVP